MRYKFLAGLAGIFAVSALAASPECAHAFLDNSDPRVGSTVTTAPKTLTMKFTEALEVPFCTVAVTDSKGVSVTRGKPRAVPGHADELLVPLKISGPGLLQVTWHALSVDTHKTEGHFSFTVAP